MFSLYLVMHIIIVVIMDVLILIVAIVGLIIFFMDVLFQDIPIYILLNVLYLGVFQVLIVIKIMYA